MNTQKFLSWLLKDWHKRYTPPYQACFIFKDRVLLCMSSLLAETCSVNQVGLQLTVIPLPPPSPFWYHECVLPNWTPSPLLVLAPPTPLHLLRKYTMGSSDIIRQRDRLFPTNTVLPTSSTSHTLLLITNPNFQRHNVILILQ